RYQYLVDLEESKAKYLKVVEEHCKANPAYQGKFPELKRKFEAAATRQELEDLYLPFKPKRRTRAQVAREKGLEPLLDKIWNERATVQDLAAVAMPFLSPADYTGDAALKVASVAEALQGAADILAERINETAAWRAAVRDLSNKTG